MPLRVSGFHEKAIFLHTDIAPQVYFMSSYRKYPFVHFIHNISDISCRCFVNHSVSPSSTGNCTKRKINNIEVAIIVSIVELKNKNWSKRNNRVTVNWSVKLSIIVSHNLANVSSSTALRISFLSSLTLQGKCIRTYLLFFKITIEIVLYVLLQWEIHSNKKYVKLTYISAWLNR